MLGKSLRANQEACVLGFVKMGDNEVYMNFSDLFALAESQSKAMKIVTS